MKKYLLVTIPLNILYSLVISKIMKGYMNISITNQYNSSIDLLVLLGCVVIVAIFNWLFFRMMKVKDRKIYIAVPCIVFMLTTGICLVIR